MIRYEVLLLAVPEIKPDEVRTIQTQLENAVKQAGGSTLSFERWGKYKLAYPVEKHEYGVYFLMRFEAQQTGTIARTVNEVCAVKFHELIMRFMISRLDPKVGLSYQRPLSLEEAPARSSMSGFGNSRDMGDHESDMQLSSHSMNIDQDIV